MLDKDDMTRDTLRMFKSEVQKFEIDNQETVDDAKALSIINKMIKQRNDSIAQFTNGGRSDLAEKEQLEVNVLSKYKPAQLDESQISEKVSIYNMGEIYRLKGQQFYKAKIGINCIL